MTCGLKLVSESSHQSQLWRRRWACHGQPWRCHPGLGVFRVGATIFQVGAIGTWNCHLIQQIWTLPGRALPMSRFLKSELPLLQSNKLPVNELSTVTAPYLIPKLFQAVWKFWNSINKKEKKKDASLSNVLRKTESQMPLLAQNLKRL